MIWRYKTEERNNDFFQEVTAFHGVRLYMIEITTNAKKIYPLGEERV